MRIIITGGTGLIGTALANSLNADGHEVIILSRNPGLHREPTATGVRLEKWDGKTAEGWGHLADGADAIVNLAGENIGAGRWSRQRKRAIWDSRINAGAAVTEAVRAVKQAPKVLLQTSGVDYYGVHGEEKLGESAEAGGGYLSQLCLAWEDATRAVEDLGVRRVVHRNGVVLSLAGGALPRLLLPYRFYVGGRLGSGKQWLSWLHITDQVRALRWFIDTPTASGVYNLSAPEPLQYGELAKVIGRVMRRPYLFPVPAFALRILLGEMASTILGGQRVIPERLIQEGFQFRFPTAETALRDLLIQSRG